MNSLKILFRVLPLLSLFLLCSCESEKASRELPPGAPVTPGEPESGGTLVAVLLADPDNLNPIVEQSATAGAINELIFPNLTESTFDCRITYHPYLAKSWELDEAQTTLTYRLREDIYWEDGKRVTADDVLFSYGLYRDPVVASPRLGYIDRVKDWTAPDPFTVVFRFKEPYLKIVQQAHTGLGIVPKHLLEKADRRTIRGNPFNSKPVGTGPFRLKGWKKNQEVILEAVPGCKLTKPPYLKRVIFRIIPEYTTRLAELETGKVDAMEGLLHHDIARLKREHPEIRFYDRGYRFLDYIAWNLKHPLFGSRNVRRALTMAINIEEILKALLSEDGRGGGEVWGQPAQGTITPELCDYRLTDLRLLPFDPARASKLLAEEGWKDTDKDGILDKGGRKFEFELNYNAGNARREAGCIYIQDYLKKIRVKVNIRPIETTVFYENMRKKEFDAAYAGWSAGLFMDPTDVWHSGEQYEFNFTSYANPEVDRLIEAGLRETDREKEKEIWIKMQKLIYEDQPYTFLFWMKELVPVHRRVRNVQSNVLSPYFKLQEWWIPKAERKYPD